MSVQTGFTEKPELVVPFFEKVCQKQNWIYPLFIQNFGKIGIFKNFIVNIRSV